MSKIRVWIWGISNLLGLTGYLWLASFLWQPPDTVIEGSPGFGDALIDLPCLIILVILFVLNMMTLTPIRKSKNKKLLLTWYALSFLWSASFLYDKYRTPIFEEPLYDTLSSSLPRTAK